MKKLVFLLMVAALVATASAANILLVTDGYYRTTDTRYAADPTASSEGDFVAFLEGLGHTVTFGDGFQQYRDTALGSAGAQAYVTNNSIDLVVISRNTDSGQYDGTANGGIPGWNAIDVPMLNMSPHTGRNIRWDWTNNSRTGNSVETDMLINGGTMPWTTGGVMSYYSGDAGTPFTQAHAGSGTIVGTFGATTGGAALIRWDAGLMSDAGAVAADKRTMIAAIPYHETVGGITHYFDDYTPEAKALIAGEIELLQGIGTPSNPVVEQTPDAVNNTQDVVLKWDATTTDGTTVDPDIVAQHVYMTDGTGTDPNLYYEGALGDPGTTLASQYPATGFIEDLTPEADYQWAVVEIMATAGDQASKTHLGLVTDANNLVGPIWSFTTDPLVPIITTEPVSTTGNPAKLFVAAINAEKYEWYKVVVDGPNTLAGSTGTLGVPGDPNNTFSTSTEGYYYCVVSNTVGSDTSDTARVMTPRLVARWEFENTLNDSIGTRDGVYTGDTGETMQYTTGVGGGYAADFNSIADPNGGVLITGSEDLNFHDLGFTLTAWVYADGIGSWRSAINKNDDYSIIIDEGDAGYLGFALDGDVSWRKRNFAGAWHFVAITYDPDTNEEKHFLVDVADELVDVANGLVYLRRWERTQSVIEPTENLLGIGNNFNGDVDDVRIYSYPLTYDELADVYQEKLPEVVCAEIDAASLVYDWNGNCIVDLADFAAFAAEWLNSNLFFPE